MLAVLCFLFPIWAGLEGSKHVLQADKDLAAGCLLSAAVPRNCCLSMCSFVGLGLAPRSRYRTRRQPLQEEDGVGIMMPDLHPRLLAWESACKSLLPLSKPSYGNLENVAHRVVSGVGTVADPARCHAVMLRPGA